MKPLLLGVTAVAALLTAGCGSNTPPEPPPAVTSATSETPEPSLTDAVAACEAVILADLKAPATAAFPSKDQIGWEQTAGGTIWLLTGWVDSENSYGAMIRTEWTCTAEWTGVAFEATQHAYP